MPPVKSVFHFPLPSQKGVEALPMMGIHSFLVGSLNLDPLTKPIPVLGLVSLRYSAMTLSLREKL
jgi:hypothetical protein